ncbi:NAD(P)/FAD-dependent oxidoreductase [Neolewinella lacunae]|uniref:FAD-dependent oxidoreductase n=1 Tax=Neolewinella lacunae TaxID=1517758 RepID=A0A923T847_9BACT|nr:NAD(P)/FAD-dependent oxidoreductase [Neolewinella lacunae]MBC6994194.1 FAD-dependent oxidoreductase [Neolewinella lacunae]MDN3634647.1 NAD(P)/FAD-dependent oxidoreductase [Neolewinella lacunae]
MPHPQIIIIGAGAAGLVAASELERAGHRPLLLEAEDRVGGRLKTDEVDGFLLDRGFQVLLTEYPEVKRYLDLDALEVKSFRPGGHVHTRQQRFRFADPMREPAQLIRSAVSPIGTWSDKIKLARLGLRLRNKSVEECFRGFTEQRSIDYLWSLGFSEQIVERFFRPFFGGIFLEQELRTPAAMFRFIFKMFGHGSAALPAGGIEAVAKQLAGRLRQTEIRCNTPVAQVREGTVVLADGTTLDAPGGIIIACPPEKLMPQLAGGGVRWKSTSNLYFYSNRRLKENRLINLVSDPTSLINTYAVLDEVAPSYKLTQQGGSLISVTLRETVDRESQIGQAEQDLLRHSRLPNDSLQFLRHYIVRHALPDLHPVAFRQDATHSRVAKGIYLAGDHQLNGSLDAALRSGRLAAEGLLLGGG